MEGLSPYETNASIRVSITLFIIFLFLGEYLSHSMSLQITFRKSKFSTLWKLPEKFGKIMVLTFTLAKLKEARFTYYDKVISCCPNFCIGGSRISPRWGCQPSRGLQHTILPNFPKNCMKLKEFGLRRRPWRSLNIRHCSFALKGQIKRRRFTFRKIPRWR